ncbi:MAG: hypothetical protein AB1782_15065 [Cyanobacteriota bacterium]
MTNEIKSNFLLTSYNIFSDRAAKISTKRFVLGIFQLLFLGIIFLIIICNGQILFEKSFLNSFTLCFISLVGMIIAFLWFKEIEDLRKKSKQCYSNLQTIEKELNKEINEQSSSFFFYQNENTFIQNRKYFMLASKSDHVLKLLKTDFFICAGFELIFLFLFFINFKNYIEVEEYSAFLILAMITICSLITLFFAILFKSIVLEYIETSVDE